MGEWISAKDRLPKSYREVLIKAEYGLIVGYYLKSDEHKPDGQDWQAGGSRKRSPFTLYEVTHWMPIPPIPKDKS